MSTLNAFGFHTQKHAEQQQHVQKQQQLKNNKLTTIINTTLTASSSSSSTATNVPSQAAVPWLLSPTTDSPSKTSLVTIKKNQNQTLKITIPSNTMSTRKHKTSKGKSAAKKSSGSARATTTITQFFAPQKQSKNVAMEIDEKEQQQAVVRKQISFEELWQRLVKEYSNNNIQQDNNTNNNDNKVDNKILKHNNRRRKHEDDDSGDEEPNGCCAVVTRQANKKTKFTVDHEFLLKFQQLLTVNNPPLYKIPSALGDNDDKDEEEQTVIVTIRRQLTVNESMDLFNRIANELLL